MARQREHSFALLLTSARHLRKIESALSADKAFSSIARSDSLTSDLKGRIRGSSDAEILSAAQRFYAEHKTEVQEILVIAGNISLAPVRL